MSDIDYPWVEEFRPKKIEDVIGAGHLVEKMQEYITNKSCPHLLFTGSAGVGKTTIAKILATTISGSDNYIYINASDRNNIDTIRVDVSNFCTASSFDDSLKIIILDECDGMTPQAQKSLRAVMEDYAKACRFILTCNYEEKIINAIKSRCQTFYFSGANKQDICKKCAMILKSKNIEITPEVKADLVSVVKKYYPDIRLTINTLQKFTKNGKFKYDESVINDANLDEFIDHVKKGNIKHIREEILSNNKVDYISLYNIIYVKVKELARNEKDIPNIIVLTSDYIWKHSQHLLPEINFVSYLIDLFEIINDKC